MLHVDLVPSGGTGSGLNVILRLNYDQPSDPGVARVQLRNQRGFPVFDDQPANCPSNYSQPISNLSTSDPPFSLTVWGCPDPDGVAPQQSEYENLLPQEGLCMPGRVLPPSQACLDAQAQATQYANNASAACDKARLDRVRRDDAKDTAKALGIAVMAATAAAIAANAIPIIGSIISAVLWLLVLALVGVATYYGSLAGLANTDYVNDLRGFNANRIAYRNEMLVVNAVCCPEQIHVPALGDCTA